MKSGHILLVGGLLLASFGMLYGLHYAVLVEHQTLDRMGGSLTQAFVSAAQRNPDGVQVALQAYSSTKYDYIRQVDAHSHWIGLAMMMAIFGLVFERVNLEEKVRKLIAAALLAGSILFPLSVLLQTYDHDSLWTKALAITGSGLVIAALAATAWGFFRPATSS